MRSLSVDPGLEPEMTVAGMQALRQMLSHCLHPCEAIAMLDLGEQRSTLLISEGDVGHPEPVLHHMQLGLELLAVRTFKRRMPTPARLEQAIMVVEDAVMPLARLIPAGSCFITRDPLLLDVAQAAMGETSGHPPVPLRREALEHLFQSLVQQITPPFQPAPHLRNVPEWVAALVFLREVFHHWQTGPLHLLRCVPASVGQR